MKFHEEMRNRFGRTRRRQFSAEFWQHIHRLCFGCPSIDNPVCRIFHENRNTTCQCGKPIWNVYRVEGRINIEDVGSECLRALLCYKFQKARDPRLP